MKSECMTSYSVKFSDLFTIIGGGTPKTSMPEYWGGEIPWLSVKDFCGDRKFVYSAEKNITQLGLNNSSTKLLQEGDIIVSARGTVGELAMLAAPMAFNQSCFGLKAKEGINSHYLYYLTQTKINELKKLSHGSVFDTITRETFDKVTCLVPPLPIQRKIAAILSALDDKIETNNAICRNLEEQAMALFKRRFFATSVQQVEDKPVYDFAEYVNGAAFKQHEYGEMGLPIIKIAELKSGISSSTLLYSGSDKEEKFYIQNGDILFSWSGNPETSIDVFIWTQGEAILNQHIFNVKSRYGAKWFTYLMLRSYMPVFAKIAADKQTTGLGHVTVADLKRLTFPFNLNQILEFEKEASFYMELAYNNKVMNNYLSNLRASLLPKLMSGELSVENIN